MPPLVINFAESALDDLEVVQIWYVEQGVPNAESIEIHNHLKNSVITGLWRAIDCRMGVADNRPFAM